MSILYSSLLSKCVMLPLDLDRNNQLIKCLENYLELLNLDRNMLCGFCHLKCCSTSMSHTRIKLIICCITDLSELMSGGHDYIWFSRKNDNHYRHNKAESIFVCPVCKAITGALCSNISLY